MRNKYSDFCNFCGKYVGPGEGHFQKVSHKTFPDMIGNPRVWIIRCLECVGKGNDVRK